MPKDSVFFLQHLNVVFFFGELLLISAPSTRLYCFMIAITFGVAAVSFYRRQKSQQRLARV